MPRYAFIVKALSPRDEGWVRLGSYEEKVAVSIFRLRRRVGSFSACSGPSWSTVAITSQSMWSAPSYFELLAAYKPSLIHKASLAYKDLKPKQHKARLCKLFGSKLQAPILAFMLTCIALACLMQPRGAVGTPSADIETMISMTP